MRQLIRWPKQGSIADKEAQAAMLQNTVTQLRRRIALPRRDNGTEA
jgi:hypothetical protein